MTGVPPVLHLIDERLRVFDAHPQGERLRLEQHVLRPEQLEHVAGRVSRRQHHGFGFELAAVCEPNPQ